MINFLYKLNMSQGLITSIKKTQFVLRPQYFILIEDLWKFFNYLSSIMYLENFHRKLKLLSIYLIK